MPSADLVLPKRMSRVAVVGAPERGCGRRSWRSRRPAPSSSSATCRHPRARRSRRCAGSIPPERRGSRDRRCSTGRRTSRRSSARGERACSPARSSSCRRARLAVPHGSFCRLGRLGADGRALRPSNERLAGIGSAVVELPRPPWVEPPTLLNPVKVEQPFRPLVQTLRDDPLRRRRPDAVHGRLVRRHVRDDVRRRRARPRARPARSLAAPPHERPVRGASGACG